MEAWGYLIAVVVGGLLTGGATVLATYFQARREREERQRDREEEYRRMLYPRRLEAHQKGFYYVRGLSSELSEYFGGFGINDKEVGRLYHEARDFYNSNCLYLDERSRDDLILAIFRVRNYLEEPAHDTVQAAFDELQKAQRAIVSGIGMKHIEEPETELVKNKPQKG